MPAKFILPWGILSTGAISARFSKDLVVDPTTRHETEIEHTIVAVASRGGDQGVSKAKSFIESNLSKLKNVKSYGNYEDLYSDPTVKVIYIGEKRRFL